MKNGRWFWALGYLVALAALVLGWNIVVLHAQGVKTLQAVELALADVRVMPGNTSSPLVVVIDARSNAALPYSIGTIRMVLRRDEQIVGTRTPRTVDLHVPGSASALLVLPLDPGSAFQTRAALQNLRRSPGPWTLSGELTIVVPHKRSVVRMEFTLSR